MQIKAGNKYLTWWWWSRFKWCWSRGFTIYTEPDSWLQLDDSSYINLLKDSKTTGSSSNANVGDPDASTAMDY